MIIITQPLSILKTLCSYQKKWGAYFSCFITEKNTAEDKSWLKDAPWLNDISIDNLDSTGYVFFDTEEEMNEIYGQTSGDDSGGTVYMMTCDPNGNLLTENT
jgi:hypothetical protein